MRKLDHVDIVLLTSGHRATDSRVFDREAVTLAKHFARVSLVGAHTSDEMRHGVRIIALPPTRSRLQRFLVRPLRCFLAAWGRGNRVLILHDAELLVWAPLFRLLTGWHIIYDVHEDFPQLMLRRAWIPLPLRRACSRMIGTIEKVLSRSCSGVMGATSVLADYFSPLQRIALYNLPSRNMIVRSAESARPLAEREYDVVHLGTLSEERLHFLCDVLTALFARTPDARALVIGVLPEQEALLRERFAADRVTVTGKVEYDKIAGMLGNCRIGLDVHPILYPHLRCAVPVKVFEYMAAGCNVVTSFLPELHRILGHDGGEHVMTIYTPSAEAFADEATRLLHEPDSMQRHQEALMTLVDQRWNWEREAEKLVQFVSDISERKENAIHEQVLDH